VCVCACVCVLDRACARVCMCARARARARVSTRARALVGGCLCVYARAHEACACVRACYACVQAVHVRICVWLRAEPLGSPHCLPCESTQAIKIESPSHPSL
jgi:hypothetical protein